MGDIEVLPFLEAIRQMRSGAGQGNVLYMTYPGSLHARGRGAEDQAHPAQRQGAAQHRHPARHHPLPGRGGVALIKSKIALFCNVDQDAVFTAVDVDNVYEVPLKLYAEGLDREDRHPSRLPANAELSAWHKLMSRLRNPRGACPSASWASTWTPAKPTRACTRPWYGGAANETAVDLVYVNLRKSRPTTWPRKLRGLDGVLVPG